MAHELFSSLLDTLQEQIGRGVDESKENSSRLLNWLELFHCYAHIVNNCLCVLVRDSALPTIVHLVIFRTIYFIILKVFHANMKNFSIEKNLLIYSLDNR